MSLRGANGKGLDSYVSKKRKEIVNLDGDDMMLEDLESVGHS